MSFQCSSWQKWAKVLYQLKHVASILCPAFKTEWITLTYNWKVREGATTSTTILWINLKSDTITLRLNLKYVYMTNTSQFCECQWCYEHVVMSYNCWDDFEGGVWVHHDCRHMYWWLTVVNLWHVMISLVCEAWEMRKRWY